MKPTAKQIEARRLFAERARAGAFKRKRNPHNIERSAFKKGVHIGYGGGAVWTITQSGARGQYVAIPRQADAPESVRDMRLRGSLADLSAQLDALDDTRKHNPASPVADTILAQLGDGQFLAMTGAKHLLGDPHSLTFTLPARAAREGINKVRITLDPDDTYSMQFMRYNLRAREPLKMIAQDSGVYADKLRQVFTERTGMHATLGTMGRPFTVGGAKFSGAEFGDPGTTFYLSTAPGRWVTGISGQDPSRISTGAWEHAIAMSAERAAIVKARLESQGHAVQVIAPERIEVNPRRRDYRPPMGTRVPDVAYRGYLIRQAGDGSFFIEKDRVFIGWATDQDDARRTIAYLTDPDQRDRNPGKRGKVRSRAQDLAIAMSEQRAGHPRKAREFFKRAARAKNPRTPRVVSVEVWREDGGFEFGMDDRTPQLFHFTTVKRKTKKAYLSWRLPPSVIANDAFQTWVREHHNVGVYTLRQLKDKLRQWASPDDLARQQHQADAEAAR